MRQRRKTVTNGASKDPDLVEVFNKAIDDVTSMMLEKLAGVKARVESLETSVRLRSEEAKLSNAELLRLIADANGETDRLHAKVDAVAESLGAATPAANVVSISEDQLQQEMMEGKITPNQARQVVE